MTATATALMTAPTAREGFGPLPCPKCGEEATVRLDLGDCDTMTCAECDAEFTADDVRAVIARWESVLAWLDGRPG